MIFEAVLADEFQGRIRMDDVIDDAAIDSLEYLEFIKRLEDEFKVLLPWAEVGKLKTFRDLSILIGRLAFLPK